jgi:hypothetical protein
VGTAENIHIVVLTKNQAEILGNSVYPVAWGYDSPKAIHCLNSGGTIGPMSEVGIAVQSQ